MANPDKVACIYADAPVLDLKSWPGIKGKGKGSKENWEVFKKDYSLTEEQANNFKNSPLDHAEKIAKLGFPMLHVVGDADDVVPVAENTAPFEKRILAADGNISVIHKPGVNHHPHSLPNPTPIVNFILSATGYKINFATIATPGNEYRDGAGWTKGKDWWAQFQNIDSLIGNENLDVLFLGNSITQGIGGHRNEVTHKPGVIAFDSVFVNLKYETAGISGDKTQNILWRLQNGSYAKAKPKVMVLIIGVNNIIAGDSPEEIVDGIDLIVKWIAKNMPATKLILLGPLPAGVKQDGVNRKAYEQIHSLLANMKHQSFRYFPISTPFILPSGELDLTKYSSDGIHLLPDGYKTWAITLQPVIKELLK